MHIPDLSTKTYNNHADGGFVYLSVGWLGDRVERPGATEPEVLERLRKLKSKHQLPDGWRGVHTCEICGAERTIGKLGAERGESKDRGEFYVEHGSVRYVLPNMVIHYITRHNYKLPEVVEQAVREWREGAPDCGNGD